MAFLCVDIGGTNTLIGIGNGDFEVVKKVKSREFLDDIGACLENTFEPEKINEIERVAIAAAGPIDREEGVFYPPNVDDLEEVNIRSPLEAVGDVQIINDCTSAVLGEYHYGDHEAENLVYVTISSGIGAGVISDGNVVEGWSGNFGEVGHIILEDGGLECGCGKRGHWEAYCSGNSIPRLAEDVAGASFKDAREVFEAAESGDEDAEAALEEMNRYNSIGFSNIVDMFNPETVLVGGAVALNHPGRVVEPLEEEVEKRSINDTPAIEVCSLDERAVIHGLRAVCNGKFKP
ncbi:MAG: ROK family protein [Candidatus Nanohaloarchaea archaeon]